MHPTIAPDPDEEDEDDDKYVIKSDDEEQFACTICRGPFRNAVETTYVSLASPARCPAEGGGSAGRLTVSVVCVSLSCGHFFCEACALKHFKKSSRCFNCRKQTNGACCFPSNRTAAASE